MVELGQSKRSETCQADGENVRDFLETCDTRELEVELQHEHLGQRHWQQIEAGGLDDEVTSLYEVESQLEEEETSSRYGDEVGLELDLGILLLESPGLRSDVPLDILAPADPPTDELAQVGLQPLVHIPLVQADLGEAHSVHQLLLVAPDGEDQLEPAREGREQAGEEADDGVPVVGSVVVSVAHGVQEDDAGVTGDLAGPLEAVERAEDALSEGRVRV